MPDNPVVRFSLAGAYLDAGAIGGGRARVPRDHPAQTRLLGVSWARSGSPDEEGDRGLLAPPGEAQRLVRRSPFGACLALSWAPVCTRTWRAAADTDQGGLEAAPASGPAWRGRCRRSPDRSPTACRRNAGGRRCPACRASASAPCAEGARTRGRTRPAPVRHGGPGEPRGSAPGTHPPSSACERPGRIPPGPMTGGSARQPLPGSIIARRARLVFSYRRVAGCWSVLDGQAGTLVHQHTSRHSARAARVTPGLSARPPSVNQLGPFGLRGDPLMPEEVGGDLTPIGE